MENTGSFGAATGGSSALKQAMQRRGIDASALQQMTPGSVAGAPPMPQAPDMQAAQAAMGMPGQPAQPTAPESDTTIAMKALATVVTNDSKMKRDMATMRPGGI